MIRIKSLFRRLVTQDVHVAQVSATNIVTERQPPDQLQLSPHAEIRLKSIHEQLCHSLRLVNAIVQLQLRPKSEL